MAKAGLGVHQRVRNRQCSASASEQRLAKQAHMNADMFEEAVLTEIVGRLPPFKRASIKASYTTRRIAGLPGSAGQCHTSPEPDNSFARCRLLGHDRVW